MFEDIEVENECPGEFDLFVETDCSAVSLGTETAAYRSAPALRPGKVYPRLMGYCNVGTVRKTGRGVKDIVIGQRVLTHQSHQSAFSCGQDEVLAALSDDIPTDEAAVAYLGQLGLAALQKVRFQKEETVVVVGLGFIGLATVALVTSLGGKAIAVGNDATRLAVAKNLGAVGSFDASDSDLKKKIANLGGTRSVIVTTVNAWSAWIVQPR